MVDPFARLRNMAHAEVARIWRAYQASEALWGEDLRFARCMASHPEWTYWWEHGDDIGDAEVVTPDGAHPYAAVALEAAVEGIIGKAGDKVARLTYRQLRKDGLDHEEARAEIGRVLTGVMWVAEKDHVPPEKYLQNFRHALKRLAAGESASELFDVD